ncbi:hypothetical protein [Bacillus sp. FJAT-44742]|uniref:hypothetical protein n=1 Tax=Bacillus sp. FJAT-44742 TaxID=2014005 RepID=UPI0018E284FA|nr:hypothetical protein [Bacillus sp. FJAT-44742]
MDEAAAAGFCTAPFAFGLLSVTQNVISPHYSRRFPFDISPYSLLVFPFYILIIHGWSLPIRKQSPSAQEGDCL